ncbi:hypothetical protein M436DRAFT_60479 [Aureobasidium namibiae CBS 147.97]|uniref:Uncharacterized protein n=1 Tax=Aureobasidium namibiae CBS 147.97 TaxID=1043004 RepID=A0A074XQ02_9PEZI
MATNPNLLFAMQSIASKASVSTLSTATTTLATPLAPHRVALARTKDPRHGCINGIKISTCKMCAGHVSRTKLACTGCKGNGFSGARCSACAIGAVIALRAMIKEVAAAARAEEEKKAEVPDKEETREEEALEVKDTAETKDENAEN